MRDLKVGAKLDFHLPYGMFFRTNIAAYRQWYKDIQRLVPFLTPAGIVSTNVINAASATIDGFEIESMFRPVKAVEFSGFVSHVSPKYQHFFVASPKTGVGLVDVAETASFSGVPRWQYGFTLNLQSPEPTSFGKPSLSISYYHQSQFRLSDQADRSPLASTPGYGLLNARLQIADVAQTSIGVAVFANNLLDKKYGGFNRSLQHLRLYVV